MNTPQQRSTPDSILKSVTDQVDNEFARPAEVDRADAAPIVAGGHPVVHERKSSPPNTLVPSLSERKALLRAARGEDEVMSQPPAVTKPRGP